MVYLRPLLHNKAPKLPSSAN